MRRRLASWPRWPCPWPAAGASSATTSSSATTTLPTLPATTTTTMAPTTTVAGPTEYMVKRGDTLRKIAAKFGTSVDAIMAINPKIKDPSKIQAGQRIMIPPPDASGADDRPRGHGPRQLDAAARPEPRGRSPRQLPAAVRLGQGRRCRP